MILLDIPKSSVYSNMQFKHLLPASLWEAFNIPGYTAVSGAHTRNYCLWETLNYFSNESNKVSRDAGLHLCAHASVDY